MLGKDFFVFWEMARGVLSGLPFYSTPEALYPPIAFFLFAPFGLLPFTLAYRLGVKLLAITVLFIPPGNAWGS